MTLPMPMPAAEASRGQGIWSLHLAGPQSRWAQGLPLYVLLRSSITRQPCACIDASPFLYSLFPPPSLPYPFTPHPPNPHSPPAGQFIIEYVGEVLEEEEYVRRKEYYMDIGQRHYYFMNIGNGEVIDACRRVRGS
jgi:hypothetical protein